MARAICTQLQSHGHKVSIFSGTLRDSEPLLSSSLDEGFVAVSPLCERFPLSSLWSWKLIPELNRKIKEVDIVHIHFARDLIPITAAIICIFQKKKYVSQTHGMIVEDKRLVTKVLDKALVVYLLSKARINFVSNEFEKLRIIRVTNKLRLKILQNGVSIPKTVTSTLPSSVLKVAFCSRLHPQKGIDKFLELVESQKNEKVEFEVFGSDGGDLWKIDEYLQSENYNPKFFYRGVLKPNEVLGELSKLDILVLPSFNENFPMIVLEALSVGACVLVMPSCGIAKELSLFDKDFVSQSESTDGLIKTFERLKEKMPSMEKSSVIQFCQETFSVEKVCEGLEDDYYGVLRSS